MSQLNMSINIVEQPAFLCSRSSTNWIHKQEATCDGSIREVICDAGEKEIINSAVPEMMESEYIRDSLGSTPEISMTESALYERSVSSHFIN